jgi:hypothetical protein
MKLRKLKVVPMEGLGRKRAMRRRGGHGHRAANGRPCKAGVETTGSGSGRGCGGLSCRREEQARSGQGATAPRPRAEERAAEPAATRGEGTAEPAAATTRRTRTPHPPHAEEETGSGAGLYDMGRIDLWPLMS